ncbi:MAG: hypothetical protein ACRC8S_15300 [Fimbriiglobus sp.]
MATNRRGDLLVIGLFALIGAAIGAFCFMVTSDGPNAVVNTSVMSWSPEMKRDASLTVWFFGWEAYTRTAADASAFQAELMVWKWGIPLLFFVGVGLETRRNHEVPALGFT